ncbi:hypothetical protein ACFL6N_05075 [Thermodesulfobacteriota bacterium]
MMRFKDLSIRKKLTLLLMGVSTVAVLTACLTVYVLIVDRYKQSYLNDIQSLTAITGANCSASLAFGIPEDAEILLSTLSKRVSITAAMIHDAGGGIFLSATATSRLPCHSAMLLLLIRETYALKISRCLNILRLMGKESGKSPYMTTCGLSNLSNRSRS